MSSAGSIALTDQRVLITGGGSGIGRAVAVSAVAAGARVIVAGRRAEALAETCALAGDGCLSHVADVTDPRSVTELVESCVATWGRVDGLVNAAGISQIGRSEDLTDAEFGRVLETNLFGSFRMARDVGRLMLAAGAGSIVNIGSLTSVGGFPGRTAYAVSKHGIIGLTKALAAEWGASGVRVNAVIPGFVRTPMTDAAIARGVLDLDAILPRTPLGRRADPDEMTGPVLFLLSDAAGFVTGDCLLADGSWVSYVGPVNDFAQRRSAIL